MSFSSSNLALFLTKLIRSIDSWPDGPADAHLALDILRLNSYNTSARLVFLNHVTSHTFILKKIQIQS